MTVIKLHAIKPINIDGIGTSKVFDKDNMWDHHKLLLKSVFCHIIETIKSLNHTSVPFL